MDVDRSGRFVRAITGGGFIRVMAVDALPAVRQLCLRHSLGPVAARFAAETSVAAVLLSAHIKGDERLTVQLQGTAPKLSVFAEVDAEGGLRGRAQPASCASPIAGISGLMMVIKSSAEREMYRGVTEIRHASFEEAFLEHLGASAQLDVVLRIRVKMDGGQVVRAVGAMVERLPGQGASAARAVAIIEVLRDRSCEEILEAVAVGELLGEPIDVMAEHDVVWRCRCGIDKVRATLVALGADTLLQIIREDGRADVTCHFCGDEYHLDEASLIALLPQGAI